METTNTLSAPVYERTIEVPLEKALLENPARVFKELATWPGDDPRREYLYQGIARGSQRPVFLPCYGTPETGCGEPAAYILVPVKDGRTFITTPRFVCPVHSCMQIAKKRGTLEVVPFELSFFGLEDFLKTYSSEEDGRKFMKWLKKAKGLSQGARKLTDAAIIGFFKPVPEDALKDSEEAVNG